MNECNPIEAVNAYSSLSDQTKFRLNEINKIKEKKKVLEITRNKEKKHNKIFMLAKSKLNSIETLISQGLIDPGISHEEF